MGNGSTVVVVVVAEGESAAHHLTRESAFYLSLGLKLAAEEARRQGSSLPPQLLEIARSLSSDVIERHSRSTFAGLPEAAESAGMPSLLLSYSAAAIRAGVSRSTIARRIKAGALTPVRHTSTSRPGLRVEDVDQLNLPGAAHAE